MPSCLSSLYAHSVLAGIIYLTLKAASFLISLAMGVPLVANAISSLTSTLGL